MNQISPEYIETIVQLAKEVESTDPIDWGMLSIDEDNAYRLVATSTVENLMPKYNDPHFREVVVATIVKLVVENFVLNLKVLQT